jgi:hypothetical protein
MMEKKEIINNFLELFPLKRPSDEEMFFVNNNIKEYEGNYYQKNFDGLTWLDVIELIGSERCFFSKIQTVGFITPMGLVYYTPAFIVYFFESCDIELMDKYFSSVTLSSDERFSERQSEFFSLLNENSLLYFIECIKKMIDFFDASESVDKDNPVKRAYNEFWRYVEC